MKIKRKDMDSLWEARIILYNFRKNYSKNEDISGEIGLLLDAKHLIADAIGYLDEYTKEQKNER